ncbi:MAG TPA: hypothetical protein ENK85_07785 [Saprospiraceae bacterium]|nr:hypothetical protein [Saprospiraceae bacterium]
MKKLLLFSILVILLSSAACRKECPADVKIGEKPLSEKSLRFFPYTGSPKLYFKDQSGQELEFRSPEGVRMEADKISVYKKCTEVKFDGKSSYEYFEGQSKSIAFFSAPTEFSINLGLFTSILRPEQELFYDKLVVNVMGTGSIGRGELVTDVRFTDNYQESEFNITDSLTYIDSLTLNNHLFTEVYQTKDFEGRQVYFNKDQGVVGFKTTDKVYALDRIE